MYLGTTLSTSFRVRFTVEQRKPNQSSRVVEISTTPQTSEEVRKTFLPSLNALRGRITLGTYQLCIRDNTTVIEVSGPDEASNALVRTALKPAMLALLFKIEFLVEDYPLQEERLIAEKTLHFVQLIESLGLERQFKPGDFQIHVLRRHEVGAFQAACNRMELQRVLAAQHNSPSDLAKLKKATKGIVVGEQFPNVNQLSIFIALKKSDETFGDWVVETLKESIMRNLPVIEKKTAELLISRFRTQGVDGFCTAMIIAKKFEIPF